jgi:hypothetical protein
MTANLGLEIIIPAEEFGPEFAQTIASLAAQTSRQFSVLLAHNRCPGRINQFDALDQKFAQAGIPMRRLVPAEELGRIELWNWACAQSRAAWINILFSGERLAPAYVECLQKRIREKPDARIIRCDVELETEWGPQRLAGPFSETTLKNSEIMRCFPARVEWLAGSLGFAWQRTAWLTLGGWPTQLPGWATLNLNLLFALHYGLENIPEALAMAPAADSSFMKKNLKRRISLTLELWLILRQAQNYCLAAKLPPVRWQFVRALHAAWLRP